MIDPFNLFGLGIHRDDTSNPNAASASVLDRLVADVRRLERRADLSALVCQALWELLRENTQLSDSDIIRRVREIDLRDGVADGRITATPIECPACRRPSNSKRGECLYCGAPLPGRHLMDDL